MGVYLTLAIQEVGLSVKNNQLIWETRTWNSSLQHELCNFGVKLTAKPNHTKREIVKFVLRNKIFLGATLLMCVSLNSHSPVKVIQKNLSQEIS